MVIKKIICLLFCVSVFSIAGLRAQDENKAYSDSVARFLPPLVDSTLVGKNIFDILPSKDRGDLVVVRVNQSQYILNGMKNYIAENSNRDFYGYRVRIYFDNRQNAREESENVVKEFQSLFPFVPVYRSFQSPFFKVAVGDFRTKSEALRMLKQVKKNFATAFVIKEKINYPAVDLELIYN